MPTKNWAVALSLFWVFITGPVVHAADVLQAIPDTALAVVVINRLEETSDKAERVAGLVHAPQASLLTLFRVQTGIHEGFDEKGTAALVVLPAKEAGMMPQVVLLLPVTDYQKFLVQLQPDDATKPIAEVRLAGNPTLVGKHGDFAVLAPPESKGAVEAVLGATKDVSTDLSPLAAWLSEIDVGAAVTPAGIKVGVETAQQFLPLIRGGMLGFAQQPGQQQLAELLDRIEGGLKPFGAEVTHLALGVKVDEKSNLHVTARARFAPGGDWATSVKGIKAPKEGVLAGLPAGPFGMAYGVLLPKALRETFGEQIAALMKVSPALAQLPAEQQASLTRATVEMLTPVDSVAMSLGIPKPGAPLYSSTVIVLKVDDAPKYLEQYSQSIKLLAGALKNPQVPSIAYEATKIDVDGSAALDVVTDLSGFNQPGAADVKPVFQKTFGSSDKVHTYLAVADDKTAVMAYVGLDNLKRALAAAKTPDQNLAADPLIAETAALLPTGAQWLGYVDPRGIANWSGSIISVTPGLGKSPLADILTAASADGPAAPPLGIAGKVSTAGLHVDLVAPAATLQVIGQFVAKARGQQ